MLFDQTLLSGNPPQSRRTYAVIIGLVFAAVLLFGQTGFGHSDSPDQRIDLQVGQSATWTVSPGGETKFKTDWKKPTISTSTTGIDVVSVSPNSSRSSKEDLTYTITGLSVGAVNVNAPWFYPDFGGVNGEQFVLVLVTQAVADPISVAGLLHLFIQANIIQGDLLRIIAQNSNINYGVDISLGQATGKWFSSDFIIDPAQVSSGAMVSATSIGSLNGVDNQVLAQLVVNMNGSTATVMPDFGPLGTSSIKMSLFNGKTCVFEKSGIGSSDYPSFALQESTRTNCGPSPKTGFLKTSMKFDGLTSILFGGDDPVDADRIVFQAEDQSNTVDYVSDIQLRAKGFPYFELGNEKLTCRKRQFGYRHETIGLAHLSDNDDGELVVSDLLNLDHSGASVRVGEFTGVFSSDIAIAPSLLAKGDRAITSSYGSLNGQRDQRLSTFESTVVRKSGKNYLSILPDFSPLGSPTHKVRLYDGDDVVFSADNLSTACLLFEPPPYACYFCGDPPEMDTSLMAGLDFFGRTPVTVNNNQVINATRIVYYPQTITETVDYTQWFDVKIESQTLDSFTSVRERVSRFTSDLFTSAIGNARIRNNTTTTKVSGFDDDYNIGVSWDINPQLSLDIGYKYEFTGVDLNKENAGYRTVFNGNIDDQEDVFVGQIQAEYQFNHKVRLTGNYVYDSDSGEDRKIKVGVIKAGENIGEITVKGDLTGDIFVGDLQAGISSSVPLIIAAGIRPMSNEWCYFVKFDANFVYTSPDSNTVLEGDEIDITPVGGAVMPSKLTTIDLTGKNISDITITSESAKVQPKIIAIVSIQPSSGGEGTAIKIFGENFGTDPDALCVIIKDGNRSIPIHVTQVNDSLLCGTLGAVPPGSSPTGQVMVERGQGHRGTVDIGPGLQSGEVWTWNTIEGEVPAIGPDFGLISDIILPDPNDPNDPPDPNIPPPTDPNGCKLFDSGVANGELSLTIDCEWPEDAKVSVSGRIRDTTRHKGLDLFAACAIFEGGPYTAFECAQRICDLLKTAWLAQAGFTINCDATDNGDGTAKITITFQQPCKIDWGNLTICILRSGGSDNPVPSEDVEEITTKKLSIKADKDRQRHSDQIKFSGNFTATLDDLLDANDIVIAVGTGENIVFAKTIAINAGKLRKSKFSYKEGKDKLKLDFEKETFSLDCKSVDLSGLGNPVTVEFSFGDYIGAATIDNPIPLCLLTGEKDAIEISKAKVKKGTSLSAKGFIAREDINLDLSTEDVTIEWANGTTFTETITAGGFVRKKPGANVFVYKKPKNDPGAITGVTLDFDKCQFKLKIKDSPTTLASTGEVKLDISADSFDANAEITLP